MKGMYATTAGDVEVSKSTQRLGVRNTERPALLGYNRVLPLVKLFNL